MHLKLRTAAVPHHTRMRNFAPDSTPQDGTVQFQTAIIPPQHPFVCKPVEQDDSRCIYEFSTCSCRATCILSSIVCFPSLVLVSREPWNFQHIHVSLPLLELRHPCPVPPTLAGLPVSRMGVDYGLCSLLRLYEFVKWPAGGCSSAQEF